MIDFDKLARESGADVFEFHSAYGYTFLPEQWEEFVSALLEQINANPD